MLRESLQECAAVNGSMSDVSECIDVYRWFVLVVREQMLYGNK